jgi:hypothetical protein
MAGMRQHRAPEVPSPIGTRPFIVEAGARAAGLPGRALLAGRHVTFTITFPKPLPAGTQYWKYGPTPTNPTPDWYTIDVVIAGDTVTYSVTDGGLGDDDLTPNGTIDDPAGPAPAPAVPSMPVWALAILALLLAAAGLALGQQRARSA